LFKKALRNANIHVFGDKKIIEDYVCWLILQKYQSCRQILIHSVAKFEFPNDTILYFFTCI